MFQFYLSSIKSIFITYIYIGIIVFQFYLSSIKSVRTRLHNDSQECFNSTLVQLKGGGRNGIS